MAEENMAISAAALGAIKAAAATPAVQEKLISALGIALADDETLTNKETQMSTGTTVAVGLAALVGGVVLASGGVVPFRGFGHGHGRSGWHGGHGCDGHGGGDYHRFSNYDMERFRRGDKAETVLEVVKDYIIPMNEKLYRSDIRFCDAMHGVVKGHTYVNPNQLADPYWGDRREIMTRPHCHPVCGSAPAPTGATG